jgi:chromosome segregation ATPase
VLALARRSVRARLAAADRHTMSLFAASPVAAGLDELDADLAASLRQWEATLLERELKVEDAEARLAERERELAEEEALLQAKARLQAAASASTKPRSGPTLSQAEYDALEVWRAELERQEKTLREDKAALREREAFLEESENRLLEKVQAQQELETELEQRAEVLGERARALQANHEAKPPPAEPWREFVE